MLKLGLIGASAGNYHPWSWPAIINGFDMNYLSLCPSLHIQEYLTHQMPVTPFDSARVSHIWMPDLSEAQTIAKLAKIAHIVDNYQTMIGEVDAVLIARDDHCHHEIAMPFLLANIPLYLDKPLAVKLADAKAIFALRKNPQQVFSCSALSFAKELQFSQQEKEDLGELVLIEACTPKFWAQYAPHLIEPVLVQFFSAQMGHLQTSQTWIKEDFIHVHTEWQSGLVCNFTATGKSNSQIRFKVYGTKNNYERIFFDSFKAFKSALEYFVAIVKGVQKPFDDELMLTCVDILERGFKQ